MGRRALVLLAATIALLWVLAGCGGAGGGEQRRQAPEETTTTPAREEEAAIAGEFVGEVPRADAFVSLVAEDAEAEDALEVRAYLCDGRQLSEWFWGSASGEELRLASDNGARLDATLAPQGASGTLTLSDGESFEFVAPPATGVEGFYPVGVTPSEVSGTSWRGAKLRGTRSGEGIAGVFTPPGGGGEEEEPVDFGMTAAGIEEGENRWIVLEEDGRLGIKGANRGATTTGFIDPTVDN